MGRSEELRKLFADADDNLKSLINPMLDEAAFLEGKLAELKRLPFIAINPKNDKQQRTTAAGKQYKEYMQSYTNIIKILCSLLKVSTDGDADPVSEFLKKMRNESGRIEIR